MKPASVKVLTFLATATSRTRDEICRALFVSDVDLRLALGDLWLRETPSLARPTVPARNLRGYRDVVSEAARWKVTAAGRRLVDAWREALVFAPRTARGLAG